MLPGVQHKKTPCYISTNIAYRIILTPNKESRRLSFRLKQHEQVADMSVVCESVERDWSGAHRLDHLREAVHSALGQLIRQRRVYYTRNKGYFLVMPPEQQQQSPQILLKGLMTSARMSRLRHSLRDAPRRGEATSGGGTPKTTDQVWLMHWLCRVSVYKCKNVIDDIPMRMHHS